MSMLMDDEWDLKSHPYLDPTGENNLNAEREVPLRNVQYVEQRIKNVNPAYATTISILFAFLNFIDMKVESLFGLLINSNMSLYNPNIWLKGFVRRIISKISI